MDQPILDNNNKNKNNNFVMYFDGCSKGNPGPAGAGAVIYNNDEEIWSASLYIGKKETNNCAEYQGLILGLKQAEKLGIQNLTVKGDSQLVIKQMKGEYQVKSDKMIEYYSIAKGVTFMSIEFMHIYRKDNKRADKLSNDALICIS